MTAQDERRGPAVIDDEALSPEVVALLMLCGAEIRETDREQFDIVRDRQRVDRRRPERRRRETY